MIFIVFALVFLAVDWYVYRGLRISYPLVEKPILKYVAAIFYWLVPAVLTGITIKFLLLPEGGRPSTFWVLVFSGLFILFYVPKLVLVLFNVVSDVWNATAWAIAKILHNSNSVKADGLAITRGDFLRIVGSLVAVIPFVSVLQGIVFGRFNYKVEQKRFSHPKLNGLSHPLKLIQISDAHLGSFLDDPSPIKKAFEKINALEPDLLLFTGDLVNDRAEEAEFWIPHFKALKAKYGKFSVLGNHDYGDYVKWPSKEAKEDNLKRLRQIHKDMGFELLSNENRTLEIAGAKVNVLGVENWGLPPFPQFGDLDQAAQDLDTQHYSILLSHDPTHYDEVVKNHPSQPELTLSGHTHGMQFGLILGSFKWSPVQYRYKKWAGLYPDKKTQLYVNRGFGYIGFPGRVGMPPEITYIELEGTKA